jgi:hypothetical protein
LLPVVQRPPGRARHLEGTDEALPVGGGEARRAHRIQPRQLATKRLATDLGIQRLSVGADLGGHGRNFGQALQQRLQIEPGAADDDRQPAGAPGGVDLGLRQPEPPSSRTALRRRIYSEKPMRDPRLVRRRRPGGQHPQLAVDLHAVGIDDDAVERLRRLECQRRLAAAGRPGDDQHGAISRAHASLR